MFTLCAIVAGVALVALGWAHHLSGHRRKLVRLARDVSHADNSEGLYANMPLRSYARAILSRVGEH